VRNWFKSLLSNSTCTATPGGSEGRISYTCCDIAGYDASTCTTAYTACNTNGKLEYLDRHAFSCGESALAASPGIASDKVLTNWKVTTAGCSNQFKIEYRCCPVPRGPCECLAAMGFIP
jgi:hypothetical protein